MGVEIFAVVARGIGRKDYSDMVEYSVEPTIRSHQSVFSYCDLITVPALGSIVVDVPVPLDQVAMLYDFLASRPSNNLVRMVVEAIDSVGAVIPVVDKSSYQTAEVHLAKGHPFLYIARFTLYNYQIVDENYMRISCQGLYTSEKEYYIALGTP